MGVFTLADIEEGRCGVRRGEQVGREIFSCIHTDYTEMVCNVFITCCQLLIKSRTFLVVCQPLFQVEVFTERVK